MPPGRPARWSTHCSAAKRARPSARFARPGITPAATRPPDSACSTTSPIAARHALDALGARRVFIVDWDVHHGDGTHDIFRATDAVLFASIHQGGIYPGTGPLHDVGSRAGVGFSINLPVPAHSDEDTWVSLLEHVVVPAAAEFRPDLVLISAGYDAHRDDDQAGCDLDAGSFAEMTRHVRALGEQVGAPVGAVLEGGYALDALAASVVATMEALAGDEPPDLGRAGLPHVARRVPHRAPLDALRMPREPLVRDVILRDGSTLRLRGTAPERLRRHQGVLRRALAR